MNLLDPNTHSDPFLSHRKITEHERIIIYKINNVDLTEKKL